MTIGPGELARTTTYEREQDWPDRMEIVAMWVDVSPSGRKRNVRRTFAISREEFYGLGGRGAPMSGEALWAAVNRLRRKP